MGVYDTPVTWSEGTGGTPNLMAQLQTLANAVGAVNPAYTPDTFADPAGATALRATDLNGLSSGLKAASDALVSLQSGGLPSGGTIVDNGDGGATIGGSGGGPGGGSVGLPLLGIGIDPTGGSISTAGVQAFLNACSDGDVVVVPAHALITFDNTVTISKRIRFTGGGELRWVSGIASKPMLDVLVDGVAFDGVYLTNPNHLASQTGNRTSGIHFQANAGSVIGCRIIGQQQAICVEANGEWHDFVFAANRILDVPGSGDGATNTSSANGEDRGDGIVVWGATATIVGNRVAALVGTDARVGIHVEALGASETTPYVHGDSMCVITGNVVTGKFRRGIVDEGLTHCVIAINTVADATWWGVALIGAAHRSIVIGNTIKWTRTTSDNQGAAWSPVRSGVMVYDNPSDVKIAENVIYAQTGANMNAGITIQKGSIAAARVHLSGNDIGAADSNLGSGIYIPNGASEVVIDDCKVSGFLSQGVFAASVNDLHVRDSEFYGNSASYGVQATGSANSARVDGNTIESCSVAIALFSRTAFVTASSNVVFSASVGIDLYQCAGPAQVSNNLFQSVTTKTQNLPAGTVAVGNN